MVRSNVMMVVMAALVIFSSSVIAGITVDYPSAGDIYVDGGTVLDLDAASAYNPVVQNLYIGDGGTVNLLPGGYVANSIIVGPGGVLNVQGGIVEWDIDNLGGVVNYDEPTDNIAPVADAGGPYVAQATSWDGATVLVTAVASSDEDGAVASYQWDLDGDGITDETAAIIMVDAPIGVSEITLIVVDDEGLASEPVTTTITVSMVEVGLDIIPDSINMGSNGVIPVVFLSSPEFDATTIDPLTVSLRGEDSGSGLVKMRGKKGTVPMANEDDFNGDGLIDLQVKIDTEKLAEYQIDALIELGAVTYDGLIVSGSDTVTIVPQ